MVDEFSSVIAVVIAPAKEEKAERISKKESKQKTKKKKNKNKTKLVKQKYA